MDHSAHYAPPPPRRTRGSRNLRTTPRQTFLQRNRGRLLWGLAGVALVGLLAIGYVSATSPAYACSSEWTPAATPSPAPSATPRLGYVQDDQGITHVTLGTFVRYAACPPASGKHYNAPGEGPLSPRFYGSDEDTTPQGWIHNLEHSGLVLLYRCREGDTACDGSGQQALKDFTSTFPNSPVCKLPASQTLLVTRFDQMAWPYAALLWDQVLPLDGWDPQLVRDFFAQQGERTGPELPCPKPAATPPPTDPAAPTPTPAPTPAASSPATTTAPTAAPSESPAPSASPASS